MSKKITTLYIDSDLLAVLRARGVNVSKLINDFLKSYVNDIDSEIPRLLDKQKSLEAELKVIQEAIRQKKEQREHKEVLIQKTLRHLKQIDWISATERGHTPQQIAMGWLSGAYPQLPKEIFDEVVKEAVRRFSSTS